MSKCSYCEKQYTDSFCIGYCSRKCSDDDQRGQAERRRVAQEERARKGEIERNSSQPAKWCLYLSLASFFAVPFAVEGIWYSLMLPFLVIILGHKGLKQIRQNPHLWGKFAAFIGLVIGYIVFIACLGHLAGILKVAGVK